MSTGVVGDSPTRILLFTGKGGVGKTTLACATAVQLADGGRPVLLVSTDPASNLDEVLETTLIGSEGSSTCPVPVKDVPNLWALNIDPDAAAHGYRERAVGPYRDLLPASAITSMEEQLAGACTVEIAVFDEFTRLLGDPAASQQFSHIVFDTAPTGHTLRLLKLPAAWTEFIVSNSTGTSCLGALAGLERRKHSYEASLLALQDGNVSTVVLVSRPEASALREAERTRAELDECGIRDIRLAINGVFRASNHQDAVALAYEERGQRSLEGLSPGLQKLERSDIPMLSFVPIGAESLRRVFRSSDSTIEERPLRMRTEDRGTRLTELLDGLAAPGRGVILTMGKGGVGKTTLAAAIALELASRGYKVHLTTTDPAAHIAETLGTSIPGLTVSRIDPAQEILRYSEEVMAIAGAGLDSAGRALLEEDLRSPCTEEIAVFRAFAGRVAQGENGFVVLDTAPTGHTLLLLDAAQAYHREVLRSSAEIPDSVRNLLVRLCDPDFTRVVIVTIPEATPVHEAARLQADLRRAGIEPYAWIANQSLVSSNSEDPLLASKASREAVFIDEVFRFHSSRVTIVPWQTKQPIGELRLKQLFNF
jgi:arsenite-transporting ATPase